MFQRKIPRTISQQNTQISVFYLMMKPQKRLTFKNPLPSNRFQSIIRLSGPKEDGHVCFGNAQVYKTSTIMKFDISHVGRQWFKLPKRYQSSGLRITLSKRVAASALVQSPILPGSVNVSSTTSIKGLPSRSALIWRP